MRFAILPLETVSQILCKIADDDLLPTKSSVEATTVKRLGRRQEQADGNGEAVQTKLKYTTSLIPV